MLRLTSLLAAAALSMGALAPSAAFAAKRPATAYEKKVDSRMQVLLAKMLRDAEAKAGRVKLASASR